MKTVYFTPNQEIKNLLIQLVGITPVRANQTTWIKGNVFARFVNPDGLPWDCDNWEFYRA